MIDASELTKRLFILGVLAIAVAPRQHIDRIQFSIGGDISRPFRKLLLLLVVLNLFRLAVSTKERSTLLQGISDILGIAEVGGLTFLSFLTPFILRKWMQDLNRINIGGTPGAPLIGPLYQACALSAAGVILSRFFHPNWWALKKLANAISGPPVLRTLKMFNGLTSIGGPQEGRGSLLAQSLVVVEYWHLVMQLLSFIGYAMNRGGTGGGGGQWDACLQAFRGISFISDWTRVLAHAIFINILDEMQLTSRSSGTPESNNNSSHAQEGEEQQLIRLSPVARRV